MSDSKGKGGRKLKALQGWDIPSLKACQALARFPHLLVKLYLACAPWSGCRDLPREGVCDLAADAFQSFGRWAVLPPVPPSLLYRPSWAYLTFMPSCFNHIGTKTPPRYRRLLQSWKEENTFEVFLWCRFQVSRAFKEELPMDGVRCLSCV